MIFVKELTKTVYQAEDGAIFEYKNECELYEKRIAIRDKFIADIKEIKIYCVGLKHCSSCAFYDPYCNGNECILSGQPCEWVIPDED